MKKLILIISLVAACQSMTAAQLGTPDLQKIKTETVSETSRYYYPKLLKSFMSNDTVMTPEDYQYFYYGSMFQEDYDPYRESPDPELYKQVEPLYYKKAHSNDEKAIIERYAKLAIADNPLDLPQLSKLVYIYEEKHKVNLAKIWKSKLNHLLAVIAASGTGIDTENAWVVAYPRHEFDFINLNGLSAEAQNFVPPYYEYIRVNRHSEKDPEAYYFNIHNILEQYYLKHPSEMAAIEEEIESDKSAQQAQSDNAGNEEVEEIVEETSEN